MQITENNREAIDHAWKERKREARIHHGDAVRYSDFVAGFHAGATSVDRKGIVSEFVASIWAKAQLANTRQEVFEAIQAAYEEEGK